MYLVEQAQQAIRFESENNLILACTKLRTNGIFNHLLRKKGAAKLAVFKTKTLSRQYRATSWLGRHRSIARIALSGCSQPILVALPKTPRPKTATRSSMFAEAWNA